MASLSHDASGGRRCQFLGTDNKRHAIRLGRKPAESCRRFRDHVSTLQVCVGHTIPDETLAWALALEPKDYRILARAGLVPLEGQGATQSIQVRTIGELVADVKASLESKKASTQRNYAVMLGHLETFFGAGKPLEEITPRAADLLVDHVRNELGHAQATASREIKAFKMIFKKAIRWGWVEVNPFVEIKAGTQANAARQAFIPLAEFEKLLAATPDLEFRCVLALSRIGGVRTPSETIRLRWEDVRWDQKRLLVRSPKTEHHEGGADRIVPLFPRLGEILAEWYAEAPAGSEFVVAAAFEKNFRTRFLRLIRRAGVRSWPRLFHNMRASRQSELLAEFPLVTVCQWLGNKPDVAAKHYLQDPDRDASFRLATQETGAARGQDRKAAQNPAHAGAISSAQEHAGEEAKVVKDAENTAFSGSGAGVPVPPTGFEQPGRLPGNSGGGGGSGAKSGAREEIANGDAGIVEGVAAETQKSPCRLPGDGGAAGLERVAAIWPQLSPRTRAAIVALAEAAGGEG